MTRPDPPFAGRILGIAPSHLAARLRELNMPQWAKMVESGMRVKHRATTPRMPAGNRKTTAARRMPAKPQSRLRRAEAVLAKHSRHLRWHRGAAGGVSRGGARNGQSISRGPPPQLLDQQ